MNNQEKQESVGENLIKSYQNRPPEGVKQPQNGENKRVEQERTKFKKKLFLENYGVSRGVISVICEKTGITKDTYYRWIKKDKRFIKAINEKRSRMNAEAEDILYGLVFIKKHPPSVHYYLDRRHPDYKPRQDVGLDSVEGQVLPPIKIEIIRPEDKKNGTDTAENNQSDGSIRKDESGSGVGEKDNSERGGDAKQ